MSAPHCTSCLYLVDDGITLGSGGVSHRNLACSCSVNIGVAALVKFINDDRRMLTTVTKYQGEVVNIIISYTCMVKVLLGTPAQD